MTSLSFHRIAKVSIADQGVEAETTRDEWLHPMEREQLRRLRDPARRRNWLLGRLVVKRLILECVQRSPLRPKPQLHDISIVSRNAAGRGVRPRIRVFKTWQPWSLSIAHSERTLAVALDSNPHVLLGIDVTAVRPPGPGFLNLWLTAAEKSWAIQQEPAARACLLWTLKEAVYKAVNCGESFIPSQIEIHPWKTGEFTCRYGPSRILRTSEIQIDQTLDEICALVRAYQCPMD